FQTFLPLLRKASFHCTGNHLGVDRAAIINMSSSSASIFLNEEGSGVVGSLAYKISKVFFQSALNQLGKTMAADLVSDKVLVAQFHPGWVRTDMG
ncbi:hypothetical protein Angca_001522, partial [Angiostrongylus cantonensis]